MTHLHEQRRNLPRPMAWLLVGIGLVLAYQPLPRATAQGTKPVVHVFLQLDAKSSVVEKTLQQQLPEHDDA